ATHRGSESANGAAYINANGKTPGELRKEGCMLGNYIDRGAIRDQMVISPALQALRQTRVPGHAVAGSGRAVLDPTGVYRLEEFAVASLDQQNGPYATAFTFNMAACPFDSLANYSFNLDANAPPLSGSGATCSVIPNYDLVVSAYSSQGRLPDS